MGSDCKNLMGTALQLPLPQPKTSIHMFFCCYSICRISSIYSSLSPSLSLCNQDTEGAGQVRDTKSAAAEQTLFLIHFTYYPSSLVCFSNHHHHLVHLDLLRHNQHHLLVTLHKHHHHHHLLPPLLCPQRKATNSSCVFALRERKRHDYELHIM